MGKQEVTNADVYIQLYKEFEELARYDLALPKSASIPRFLKGDPRFTNDYCEILYCSRVRNVLQHQKKISEQYPVFPTNEMIEFLRQLMGRLNKRPKCDDISVKRENIISAKAGDSVLETVKTMKKYSFSHVPVMEGDVVVGVLSEHSIFSYIAEKEGVIDIKNLKIADLNLSLERSDVVVFSFKPSTLYVDELIAVFEEEFRKGKLVGMVFLTEKGNSSEEVTGILTPWDVLGKPRNEPNRS